MISEKAHNWIQTLAALSVLIGLALVIYELQQTQALTRLQLVAARSERLHETQLSIMGDQFSEIEIKACLNPDELTDAEISRHLAFMNIEYYGMSRLVLEESVFSLDRPVEIAVRGSLRRYLGWKLGMFDYSALSERDWPPIMREVANEIIENNEIIPCEDTYLPMIAYLRQD